MPVHYSNPQSSQAGLTIYYIYTWEKATMPNTLDSQLSGVRNNNNS